MKYIQSSVPTCSPGEPISPPANGFIMATQPAPRQQVGKNIFFHPANKLLRPATPYSSAWQTRGGSRQKQDTYFPCSPGEPIAPPSDSHQSATFCFFNCFFFY